MSEGEPSVGDVLGGRYRLVSPLGRGGMGAVWRAEHLTLGSPVAVKLIHAHTAESPEAQARFLREAQAAAALRSPHVVQVLDHGVQAGVPFIVMELLEGESLAARLARGALSPEETARVVTHVARAIGKAHEAGVVHRDLKPDNVFLVHNADAPVAKVLDFGIAKIADGFGTTGAETHTGAVLGSPHTMSPEQARGTRAVDHRTDLWALGVIAFQCLTGKRPFEGEVLADLLLRICAEPIPVPSQVAPVPPGFDAWFARATERDPERRFQSATEMAELLRRVCGGDATAAGSIAPPPPISLVPVSRAPSSSSHGVLVLALGGIVLFGALGLVAVGAFFWLSAEEPAPVSVAPTPATAVAAPASAGPAPSEAPAAVSPPIKPGVAARAPSPKAAPTSGTEPTPAEKLKSAEQQIKEAEQKIKAAEQKLEGLGGK